MQINSIENVFSFENILHKCKCINENGAVDKIHIFKYNNKKKHFKTLCSLYNQRKSVSIH